MMFVHGVQPESDALLWSVMAGSCLLAGVSTPHVTQASKQGTSLLTSSISQVKVILTQKRVSCLHLDVNFYSLSF